MGAGKEIKIAGALQIPDQNYQAWATFSTLMLHLVRLNDAGSLNNRPIMLNPPMFLKRKSLGLSLLASIKINVGPNHFVLHQSSVGSQRRRQKMIKKLTVLHSLLPFCFLLQCDLADLRSLSQILEDGYRRQLHISQLR